MKLLDKIEVLQELAKAANMNAMYIGGWNNYDYKLMPDVTKAAPYLQYPDVAQTFADGEAWLLFDSEEEMWQHYEMTVGDDGPTKLNSYNGRVRVYAITCNSNGELGAENT